MEAIQCRPFVVKLKRVGENNWSKVAALLSSQSTRLSPEGIDMSTSSPNMASKLFPFHFVSTWIRICGENGVPIYYIRDWLKITEI